MHRCAVHKLTNWHIRLLSNTKCAVTISPTSTRNGDTDASNNDIILLVN